MRSEIIIEVRRWVENAEHAGLDLESRKLVPLSRYTIEGRYPGPWEAIHSEEAALALEMGAQSGLLFDACCLQRP